MSDVRISVKHLQRGQPRPYAPHTYESRITVQGEHSWDRLLEDQAKDLARAVVHHFTEDPVDPKDDGSYYRPRLKALELVEEEKEDGIGPIRQVWHVRIEEPYCD